MGLGLDDFLDLTPSEFLDVFEEFERKNSGADKAEWERWRFFTFAMLTPWIGTGKKQNAPKLPPPKNYVEMFPMPWDEPVKKKAYSKKTDEQRFRDLQKKWSGNNSQPVTSNQDG